MSAYSFDKMRGVYHYGAWELCVTLTIDRPRFHVVHRVTGIGHTYEAAIDQLSKRILREHGHLATLAFCDDLKLRQRQYAGLRMREPAMGTGWEHAP